MLPLIVITLIILAALTKSAQVPFSAWLPAAIAAPTPVSALVHSSTLVTAGVYLLIRFNEIIGCSKILFLIRLLTILLSGVGACFEQDAKKIVALSTLRQLGVIIFSLSIGLWELAFFHLLRHAFFKSLLFMCLGIYIHGRLNQQDIRGIGFQFASMPVVSGYFLASSLSLRGFPFLSGFYSKDSVIELFQFTYIGVLSYLLVLICVLRTIVYRIRLIQSLYLIESNSRLLVTDLGERILSLGPILPLFFISVVGGSLLYGRVVPVIIIGFSLGLKIFLLIFVVSLILLIITLSFKVLNLQRVYKIGGGQTGLGIMWFLGDLFSFLRTILIYRGTILRGVDQGWLEALGIQGIFALVKQYVGGLDLGLELSIGVYLYGGLVITLFIIIML